MAKPLKKRAAKAAPPKPAAREVTRELPMLTREAPVTGVSTDGENRVISLLWTGGAPVRRYDWWNDRYYIEELSLEPGHVRMERLQSGRAPLCDTHYTRSLDNVIGVVTSAELDGGEGTAEAKVTRREDRAGTVQDIVDGIIGNVSVGYEIHRMLMIQPAREGDDWIYRAIDWEPFELSLVPIGADPDGAVESVRAARAAGGTNFKPFKDKRTHPCVFEIVSTPPAAAGTHKRTFVMTKKQRKAALAKARSALANAQRDQNTDEIVRLEAEIDEHEQALATEVRMQPRPRESQTRGEGGDGEDDEPDADPDDEDEGQRSQHRPASMRAGADGDDDTPEAIRAAERRRVNGIRGAARMAGLPESFADDLVGRDNGTMSVAEASQACLREMARRSAATPTRSPSVVAGQAEDDTRRQRMGDALRLRANPRARLAPTDAAQRDALEAAREFRGMTLIDMARECIEVTGGNARGMSRREIAIAALNLDSDIGRRAGMQSTSDFPILMANTINRTLRAAYQEAPRTFLPWARMSTAPDFREIARVQLSGLTKLQPVNEGGEYKYMSFGDSAEKYSLSKYGGIIAVTWETLVNDDLGAFDRIPMMIANEAAGLESDIVYGVLTANAALADGVALFHATHKNLQTGAAISDTSLTLARAGMRKQTSPAGRQLNLTPAILLTGPDQEGDANKYTSAQFVAAKAVDINPAYNTSLQVIIEGRLTGNQWYLLASPGLIDTIEYAYLEGEEGLFTEQRQGFTVDGLEVKARHVFAAKAIDFRGMQKNPGQ